MIGIIVIYIPPCVSMYVYTNGTTDLKYFVSGARVTNVIYLYEVDICVDSFLIQILHGTICFGYSLEVLAG